MNHLAESRPVVLIAQECVMYRNIQEGVESFYQILQYKIQYKVRM